MPTRKSFSFTTAFTPMSLLSTNARRFYKLNAKAFTLIELLVAIAIIALISAVVIPNFRNFNQTQELDAAKAQLFDDLRLAKSKADSGIVCSGIVPNTVSVKISYSVELKRYSYIVKAECIDTSGQVPRYLTESEEKFYPTSTTVQMETIPFCGENSYGTTITFRDRSCQIGSASCKGVEINCAGTGGNPGTGYTSSADFPIVLANKDGLKKTLNITLGGAIYEK